MSVGDSTTPTKPSKPYQDFPLYAHASGRWAKKIRRKTHFFGPWDDHHKALTKYLAEKDDLEAGRKPQPDGRRGRASPQPAIDAIGAA